jgi:hypothetical protein
MCAIERGFRICRASCLTTFRYPASRRLCVIDTGKALPGHKPRCPSKSELEYAWLRSSCFLYLSIQIDGEFEMRVRARNTVVGRRYKSGFCRVFYFFRAVEASSTLARLFHPWKREWSPAFHASRSPAVLRSQSGRISLVTVRRSCQRSMTDGRPQNQ